MTDQYYIRLCKVRKSFGEEEVLRELSWEMERGKVYGIVGNNGSGKTVFMKCICGFLPVSGGTVQVGGKYVGTEVDFPESLGVIIETPGFLTNFSGRKNLEILAQLRGKITGSDITRVLRQVGLDPELKKPVSKYSLGMRQRLGIAQAIMEDPELLILDEPASGLDPRARVEMKEILKQLQSMGKTVVISSHILPELAEMCTEVGIINQGKLAAQGTVQEIMRQLTQKRIIYVRPLAELSKTVEILREMPAVKEITENTADLEFVFDGSEEMLAEILKHLVESGIGIVSFREKEGNLEEIFIQVTGGAGV